MTLLDQTALNLINYEAFLLDERRFEEWAELFTDTSRYWAPYRWDAREPMNEMNLLYDDRARLGERVSRLTGGDLHAQDPASQTVRMVGHFTEPTEQAWNPRNHYDLCVTAPFKLAEYRAETTTEYSGRYTHWLAKTGDDWRIEAKKIQLLGSEGPLGNVTFLF